MEHNTRFLEQRRVEFRAVAALVPRGTTGTSFAGEDFQFLERSDRMLFHVEHGSILVSSGVGNLND